MSAEICFPKLTFAVDGMRHSIVAAVMQHNDELVQMINQSMASAVKEIQQQLDVQVRAALSRVMQEAVEQAAEIAAAGLADELAKAMGNQVRTLVRKKMAGGK